MGDARGYDQWAQRLAGGDWIGTDVFYQAPLYPYFLGAIYALAGHDLMAVRIVQAVLGVALGGAGRLRRGASGVAAGRRGGGRDPAGVYAPAIFFDGLIQKSVLDVLLPRRRAGRAERAGDWRPRPQAPVAWARAWPSAA